MNRMCSILLLVALGFAPSILLAAETEQAPVTDVANVVTLKPEEAIASALRSRVSVNFQEQPFRDVIAQLEKDWKVPIQLDHKGLQDVGISFDTPITLKVSGVSARAMLNLALRMMQLDWTVRDEMIWIAPYEAIDPEAKVYDVADLVGRSGENDASRKELEALVNLISATISPTSWGEMGGVGTIQPCEMAGVRAIVVSHRQHEHEAIEKLLGELRKCQKE